MLQEFTAKSLRIDEDQDEGRLLSVNNRFTNCFIVDERAQQVEPELRRAIESKNSKLESELTGEVQPYFILYSSSIFR